MPAGRPFKKELDEKNIPELERFGAAGAKYEDIAQYYGISESALYRLFRKKPELRLAIKRGKFLANLTIAQTIYNQAKRGNMTAAIFYAKTQMGWKERQVIEHTETNDYERLDDTEMEDELKRLRAENKATEEYYH